MNFALAVLTAPKYIEFKQSKFASLYLSCALFGLCLFYLRTIYYYNFLDVYSYPNSLLTQTNHQLVLYPCSIHTHKHLSLSSVIFFPISISLLSYCVTQKQTSGDRISLMFSSLYNLDTTTLSLNVVGLPLHLLTHHSLLQVFTYIQFIFQTIFIYGFILC